MPSQRNISLLGHPNYFDSGCYDVNVCLFGNKRTCKKKKLFATIEVFKRITNSSEKHKCQFIDAKATENKSNNESLASMLNL